MAIAALTGNKLRAVLTTLGVVIGISFVLLMGWVLGGLDNALEQTLAIFGDDILYVDKFDWSSNRWREERNRKNISYDQYLRVKQRLSSAEYVIPTARAGGATVRHDNLETSSAMVFGVSSDYIKMLGGNISTGRFFNEVEDESGSLTAVIGYNIAENLFPNLDPVGRTIRIEGLPFTVIGTMPKRGTMMAGFVDDQVIIPIRRFFGMYGNRSRVVINVKAGGIEHLENVKYETIGVMREVRSLGPGEENDFAINEQEQFRQSADAFRLAVWGVGLAMTGLSFLVGSIGIMNIMFVSVTERTKEIGIRKAIGATQRSILMQFLVEAVILCMIGSTIGFTMIATIAYFKDSIVEFVMPLLGGTPFDTSFLSQTIPQSQVAIAALVSIVVGVLAGIIPAIRAARLDPVEALRAE
jgi:putative ABC transport system permease protein